MLKNGIQNKVEQALNAALPIFIQKTKMHLQARLCKLVSLADTEDILQDAYFKVYQLASKNPQKLSAIDKLMVLKPFLYTVAKNQALSTLRHAKVVDMHVHLSQSEELMLDAEERIFAKQNNLLLMEAIKQLPPICRQVFVLRKIQGLNHASIANSLEISTKTVESHISKGLRLCRDFIQDGLKPNREFHDNQIHYRPVNYANR